MSINMLMIGLDKTDALVQKTFSLPVTVSQSRFKLRIKTNEIIKKSDRAGYMKRHVKPKIGRNPTQATKR